jgi:hypothetical protein
MATNCHLLKDALLSFLGNTIEVSEKRDYCVLTLPHKTLDNRFASVFVQQKIPGYYLVHDGGKTAAELFAQGIHLTDLKLNTFEDLAGQYGATFSQGSFQIGAHESELQSAVMAIAQCATVGTWHVLAHKPSFSEVPVLKRVASGLAAWEPPFQKEIRDHVKISGRKFAHVLDFAAFAINTGQPPVGVKVLRPSDNPLEQARGYGFMAYDIEQTQFEEWLRLAIITKADEWSDGALSIVRNMSTATVEVGTGDESQIEKLIPQRMAEIAA